MLQILNISMASKKIRIPLSCPQKFLPSPFSLQNILRPLKYLLFLKIAKLYAPEMTHDFSRSLILAKLSKNKVFHRAVFA